jgi:hypothetical protein
MSDIFAGSYHEKCGNPKNKKQTKKSQKYFFTLDFGFGID